MQRGHTLRTLFGVAAIFLVLGIGNLVFGALKVEEYSRLLSKATAELATTHASPGPLPGPTMQLDREELYLQKLRDRIAFYGLVKLGGRCFLALAGVGLLGILVLLKVSDTGEPPGADSSSG